MSLTNYQKIEILANTPEMKEALKLMYAAFKDMELKKYLSIPYEIESTDGKEVFEILFVKQGAEAK